MTWRPASKRPRNGQKVIACFIDPEESDRSEHNFASGFYNRERDEIYRGLSGFAWWRFVAWIPESELIKAARAAAKGVE